MSTNTQAIAKPPAASLQKVRNMSAYLDLPAITARLSEKLGLEECKKFKAALSSAVSTNPVLATDCDPDTVINAALIGHSLNLPPSPQLGYYYIVPYNNKKRGYMGKLTAEAIDFWISEINSCEDRQKAELIQRNNYPELILYYESMQAIGDNKKRLCLIDEYFPNTNALISELMYQNPEILAEPTKPQSEQGAPLMKSALGYGFKKLDALTENKLALFDMIYAGYCAVEVNHINSQNQQRTDMMSQVRGPGMIENGINKVKEIWNQVTGNKEDVETSLEDSLPPREMGYATTDETFLKRWDPLDILLDWRAERIKDMRYIIKKLKFSKAEFNSRYPDFKDKVGASQAMNYAQHKQESDRKAVVLYEIQVKRADGNCTNFIISKEYRTSELDYFDRPYTTNGFNVKISTLHEYGKLYPVSIARKNKPLQDDLNNYVTFMMEVAERNIPKRGYTKGKLDIEGITAMNSKRVNELVPCKGGPESVWEIPATKVSIENKELMQLFQQHKEKMWNVSESRLIGRSQTELATEMEIQEAGFEARMVDLRQGIKKLIVQELDCLKDIIVQFWDDAFFFKITGGNKPEWYIPQIDPMDGVTVMNPLTDILTADYEIDVDIISAAKPNKDRKKKEVVEFATWVTSPNTIQFLATQGKTIDYSVIEKAITEWGWNPETLLIDLQPVMPQIPGEVTPGGAIPNAPL